MDANDFIICCRRLVGALRQTPRVDGRATFVLGLDADGLPFYKTGSFSLGPTGNSGEPLFFCPFCGRRVREGGDPEAAAKRAALRRARAAADEDDEEELTKLALEGTGEFETVIAPRRAHQTAARAGATSAPYFSAFTSAGFAKSDSGTGTLNSTFS